MCPNEINHSPNLMSKGSRFTLNARRAKCNGFCVCACACLCVPGVWDAIIRLEDFTLAYV